MNKALENRLIVDWITITIASYPIEIYLGTNSQRTILMNMINKIFTHSEVRNEKILKIAIYQMSMAKGNLPSIQKINNLTILTL